MRCPTSTTSKTQNWWEIWRQTPCFTMAHHGFPFILRGKSSATPADSCRWRTSCRSWKRCGRQLSLWFDPYTADDWIWLVLFPRFEAWRWEKYHGHVAANRDAIRKIVENWDFTEAKKGETKASNSRGFQQVEESTLVFSRLLVFLWFLSASSRYLEVKIKTIKTLTYINPRPHLVPWLQIGFGHGKFYPNFLVSSMGDTVIHRNPRVHHHLIHMEICEFRQEGRSRCWCHHGSRAQTAGGKGSKRIEGSELLFLGGNFASLTNYRV